MMRRITFITLFFTFLLFCSSSYAQNLSFSTGLGYSLFIGDVIDVPTKPGFAINSEIWYNFNEKFSLKVGGSIYSLTGDDTNGQRNRSFRSFNLEGYAALMYIYSKPNYHHHRYTRKKKKSWRPFWYLGLGWTTVSPEGKSTDGSNFYDLVKLKPEGNAISRIAITVPMGFGIKIDMNDQYALLLDGGLRYALSDVLDGVSKSSIDENALSAAANNYYNNITGGKVIGGNPALNDMYFLGTVKVQYTPTHHGRRSKFRKRTSFPKYGYKRKRR